jgi:hypothetical protein
MNADHVGGMILLAGTHAGIEGTKAAMTSVDRFGFSLRLKTNNRVKGARTNLFHATPQGTQAVLAEIVRQAEARGSYSRPPSVTSAAETNLQPRRCGSCLTRVGRLKLLVSHAQVAPELKQLLCNPGNVARGHSLLR